LAFVFSVACRQDMHDQPKLKPLARSDFYPDHRASRLQVEGTVARGQLVDESPFATGKVDGQLTHELPVPLTAELLQTGRVRFETFCSPCHGRTGAGNGLVVQRGFKAPRSFHEDRLRQVPVGYFFDAITNGFGAMADYRAQVPVADRWAIAAYLRALQLSQNARAEDVPAAMRAALDAPAGGGTASDRAHPAPTEARH
jgi:mono/diheme cytochrome c family protein